MNIAKFLDDERWGKDTRLYCHSYEDRLECLGYFFWNDKKEIHEKFGIKEFREWGWTPDEMRAIVFSMEDVVM